MRQIKPDLKCFSIPHFCQSLQMSHRKAARQIKSDTDFVEKEDFDDVLARPRA